MLIYNDADIPMDIVYARRSNDGHLVLIGLPSPEFLNEDERVLTLPPDHVANLIVEGDELPVPTRIKKGDPQRIGFQRVSDLL